MEKETKILWTIGIATVAIIGIGAYFLSRPPAPQDETSGSKVNQEILVRQDSNIDKAPDEKAVLVEFGDFQCPACGTYYPVVEQVKEEFKSNLTFVFRNFPLSQHKNALPSSYAAEAAGKQGKYWEMYGLIYMNQNEWASLDSPNKKFEEYAAQLELDLDKYRLDVSSKEVKDKVDIDYGDGVALGVNATPTFYLNGQKIVSPRSVNEFKSLVEAAIQNSVNENATTLDTETYHAHFDLKVYLNGKAIDFTQAKYQSEEGKELDEWIHLHDGNGEVVHVHKAGQKLEKLFNSLKIGFNDECFTLDTGERYCSGNGKTLKLFVNGQENNKYESYEPKDLDRILITYGNDSESTIAEQIDTVSDKACIYSEVCPERGTPPDESCVGGLGTGCEVE